MKFPLTHGAAPIALANHEPATNHPAEHIAGLLLDQQRLRLDDGAGLALVIDAQHLLPDLEGAAGARDGEGLEDLNLALAVDAALLVELGHAGDGDGRGARVEVDDLLVSVLERQDERVRGEGGEVGVELLLERDIWVSSCRVT